MTLAQVLTVLDLFSTALKTTFTRLWTSKLPGTCLCQPPCSCAVVCGCSCGHLRPFHRSALQLVCIYSSSSLS
ncbi:hypothetical protein B0H11DRAFT_2079822, partial [Mycena galericulata]